MAYALVSAGAAAVGTTAVSPAYGVSPTAGNLLALYLARVGTAATPTTPAGWTAWQAGGIASRVWFYTKIATGGDAAPTFSDATATFMAAQLVEFSGNDSAATNDRQGEVSGQSVSPQIANCAAIDNFDNDLIIGGHVVTTTSAAVTSSHVLRDSGGVNIAVNNLGNNDATVTTKHFRFTYGFGGARAGSFDRCTATTTGTITAGTLCVDVYSMTPAAGKGPRRNHFHQLLAQ